MSCYNFYKLRVVGFAEVLSLECLPRVLSPIYRIISGVDHSSKVHFLFPPYRQEYTFISNPMGCSFDEFEEAVEVESVTSLGDRSFPAASGHELWVDDEGKIRYDKRPEAMLRLKTISKVYRIKARAEMQLANYAMAQKLAITSFSARPNMRALYLRAEAERQMGHTDELNLTLALIEHELALKGFAKPTPGTPLQPTKVDNTTHEPI